MSAEITKEEAEEAINYAYQQAHYGGQQWGDATQMRLKRIATIARAGAAVLLTGGRGREESG